MSIGEFVQARGAGFAVLVLDAHAPLQWPCPAARCFPDAARCFF